MKIVFKIRDKDTGLYSAGGTYSIFTRVGKTWSTAGYLKSHLTAWADMGYHRSPRPIPDNWEIVQLVQIETTLTHAEFMAKDFSQSKKKKKSDVQIEPELSDDSLKE
jgi:hypothetical protein